MTVPVIAIDGPSASGKGTVAQLVAASTGFHYLDSGALYRLVALEAVNAGISGSEAELLGQIALTLDARFHGENIWLFGKPVGNAIRSEECSRMASQVAALPAVRSALLGRQQAFRKMPGLVAEGRDMGSVVFPDSALKIFLTASLEVRAERRYKQLKGKGIPATLPDLLQELLERDARDSGRSIAPLRQSPDARLLDVTAMTASEAAQIVLEWYRAAM